MLEDAERQLDEFAYGRAEGSHLGFATSQQALIQDTVIAVKRHEELD